MIMMMMNDDVVLDKKRCDIDDDVVVVGPTKKGSSFFMMSGASASRRYIIAAALASLPIGIAGGWIYSMQVAQSSERRTNKKQRNLHHLPFSTIEAHLEWEDYVRHEIKRRVENGEEIKAEDLLVIKSTRNKD